MCLCSRKCNKILFCKIISYCINDARLNAEEHMCQHMCCTKVTYVRTYVKHMQHAMHTYETHMTNICETCAVHMLFFKRNICIHMQEYVLRNVFTYVKSYATYAIRSFLCKMILFKALLHKNKILLHKIRSYCIDLHI